MRAFLLGFVVVLAVRVLVALSRLDEFRGEELYIGSLAHALAVGLPLDTSALPVISHLRGSVVFALCTLPVFALTGPTLLGLKLVACLWSAATGGLFALVCERAGSERPEPNARSAGLTGSTGSGAWLGVSVGAWVGTLLFAFLPPSFQMVDVLALGSHGDVSLFVFAALALVVGGRGALAPGRAAAFGATLGAGVLFSLQFVVALPGLGLAWLARDPGLWKRPTTALVAAVALACAAPSIWLSRSADLVNKPIAEHLMPDGPGGVLPKLGRLVTHGLPASWLFAENGGAWLAWPFAAAILVGLAFVVRRAFRRDALALHALAHPAVVLVAFAVSDFELNLDVTANGMGSRYFMPILPFLVVGVALGARTLWGRGRRLAAGAAVALALVPGVVGWAALLDPGAAARGLRRPVHGTSFPWFGVHLRHAGGDDSAARLAWAREVDPDWDALRPLRYVDLVATPRPALEPQALERAFDEARTAGPLGPYLATRLGRRLADWPDEARRAVFLAGIRGTPAAAWVDRGLGAALCEQALFRFALLGTKSMAELDPVVRLQSATEGRVLEGAGFRLGTTYTPYNDGFVEMVERLDELPERARAPFLRGLALGYRCRFVEASYTPPGADEDAFELLARLPEASETLRAALALPADAWAE